MQYFQNIFNFQSAVSFICPRNVLDLSFSFPVVIGFVQMSTIFTEKNFLKEKNYWRLQFLRFLDGFFLYFVYINKNHLDEKIFREKTRTLGQMAWLTQTRRTKRGQTQDTRRTNSTIGYKIQIKYWLGDSTV